MHESDIKLPDAPASKRDLFIAVSAMMFAAGVPAGARLVAEQEILGAMNSDPEDRT